MRKIMLLPVLCFTCLACLLLFPSKPDHGQEESCANPCNDTPPLVSIPSATAGGNLIAKFIDNNDLMPVRESGDQENKISSWRWPGGQTAILYQTDSFGIENVYLLDREGDPIGFGPLHDQLPDGLWRWTQPQRKDCCYENGKVTGSCVVYDENGTVIELVSYRNGLLHGDVHSFDADGSILCRTSWLDGKKSGISIFFSDGQLVRSENWKDGLLDGAYLEYFPDGSLKVRGHYEDGKRVSWTPFEAR